MTILVTGITTDGHKAIVETGCIFKHGGHKFESGGACITPDYIVAYLGDNGQLNTWDGRPIGTYRITATWKTPRSFISFTMHQVYASISGELNGIISGYYTGRSSGVGMIFKGKRVK